MKTFINKKGLLKVPRLKTADYNIVYSNKERTIDLDKPILVYRNLHKKMYSIRQNRKVVAHAEKLCVASFKCIVNEKGRQRVLKTGQKNVHAFIQGKYETSGCGTACDRNDLPAVIKYNPYKYKTFICDNLTIKPYEVKGGGFCILDKDGIKGSYLHTNPM